MTEMIELDFNEKMQWLVILCIVVGNTLAIFLPDRRK